MGREHEHVARAVVRRSIRRRYAAHPRNARVSCEPFGHPQLDLADDGELHGTVLQQLDGIEQLRDALAKIDLAKEQDAKRARLAELIRQGASWRGGRSLE